MRHRIFALQSDDGKPGPIGVHRDSTFITEEFMPAPPLFGILGVGVVVRWGALYKVLKIDVFIDLHSNLHYATRPSLVLAQNKLWNT